MNLRLLTLAVAVGLAALARADDTVVSDDTGLFGDDDIAFADDAPAFAEADADAVDPADGRPQVSQEIFMEMLSQISPSCREAVEANPTDPSQVSDECKAEIQTTLAKLMHNPNDPVTPEIFAQMMEKLPAECRAEIEANPTDASKLSDDCKRKIQKTLSKLLPKEAAAAKKAARAAEEKPKKRSKKSKKSKDGADNTTPLLIVLGFVTTAFAGIAAYSYTLYQKQAPVVKGPPKKLSKKKLEKTLRKERAAAAM
ncbi:hypothetical protein ACHHYP_20145 [Achlya hypogyna]|uniref:Secreted protein n=1 Tax=Achlya hypogyna TaxID=1202772 RepID=A0A1V9Z2U5_ACHHY|nr:hypothetical protein ACHHYP_20145 [Achlya hypogyna]